MKKIFGVGLVAALCAFALTAIMFTGCADNSAGSDSDGGYKGIDGTIIADLSALADTTAYPAGTYAVVVDDANMAGTVPAGYTVNLYGDFTVAAGDVTIGGTLNVTKGSKLTTASGSDVIIGIPTGTAAGTAAGSLVIKNGGILVGNATDAPNLNVKLEAQAATFTNGAVASSSPTAINTAVVAACTDGKFAGDDSTTAKGASLVLESGSRIVMTDDTMTAANIALAAAQTAFNVTLTSSTANFETAGLTVAAGNVMTLSGADTALGGALVVNGTLTADNATFATGDFKVTVGSNGTLAASGGTFAAITALEVNGEMTASGTTPFAALTTVSGTGSLTTADVASAKALILIGSSLKSVTLATTTITASNLIIPANTIRTFTGAAAPSGTVTVNGTLATGGSGGLNATGIITVNAGGVLNGAGSAGITLAASTQKIILKGDAAKPAVLYTGAASTALELTATAAATLTGDGSTANGKFLTGSGDDSKITNLPAATGAVAYTITAGGAGADVTIVGNTAGVVKAATVFGKSS